MSALVYDKMGNLIGNRRIPNKNYNNGALASTGNTPVNATAQAAGKDRASMEAQLQTFSGTYYTNARLRTLTYNDLVYALRIAYDSANIK